MLTIIIPYYKLTFFDATLQSLAQQKDKRFNVYIGDDASPENPELLLEKYKGQFNFCYHRFDTNLGSISLTKQWDRCIALSGKEEWLMILGDDDVLGKNVVEALYANYDTFKGASNVIRFSSATLFEDTNTVSPVYKQPVWENAYNSYYRRLTLETRSSLSEYIFTRNSYETFGFETYPLASHSDDRAWLDFSDRLPVFSINEAVVYVRMSRLNISGRTDNTEAKLEAQLLFYYFLVHKKRHHFSKKQKEVIFLKYEKIIFYQKNIILKHCLYLLYIYIVNFKINAIIGLIKRAIKNLFTNAKKK